MSTRGRLLKALFEAASDYKFGTLNKGFAEQNGGIETLREKLFATTRAFEDYLDEIDEAARR